MKIRRDYKLSNLDLFAGYAAYIKEIEEKEKTTEGNKVEEKNATSFPDYMGQRINILV